MPYVTAVLVARNGAQYLPATLAALAAQSRRPDRVIAVDAGSTDDSLQLLRDGLQDGSLVMPAQRTTLALAARAAIARIQTREDEWLWILGHDAAPHRRALEHLLGAVEVSPSVVIVGPKLMRWDAAETLVSFGETLDGTGRSIRLAAGQLDQSQYDDATDVMAVAAPGSLVLASLWRRLDGFDPGLPDVDAGLDLGVRARLAGHRVERVPDARVASAGPVELFGRTGRSPGARNRVHRAAALHRRMVAAPAVLLPLLWLAILPVAVVRALWQLVAKRPGHVLGELAAGLRALVDPTVLPARRRIASTRVVPWSALAPLRVRGAVARELRSREAAVDARTADTVVDGVERPGFFSAGGAWVVLLVAAVAAALHGRLLGASALAGGALLPLGDLASLWSQLGVRWRLTDGGFLGAADPFSAVLAVIGSLTWWSPSTAVVLLLAAAMPLSALTAWFAAARLSRSGWPPAVAAIGWGLAPMLLAGIGDGQLPAVLAHILLPLLVTTALAAGRSWSTTAAAALLFAAVVACAPVLTPALLVLLVVLIAARPAAAGRLLIVPLPAAALAAPLIAQQLWRANPIALIADPGLPVVRATPSALDLLLGSPVAGHLGWSALLETVGITGVPPIVAAAVAAAPIAVLAILALALPTGARAIPALVVAALGLATAVASAHLAPMVVGADAAAIWPGSGLSLYWLGLIGAAVIALDALATASVLPAIVAVIGSAAVVAPLALAAATGATAIQPSTARVLPALVTAEGEATPWLGTLRLTAAGDDLLVATLERGIGTTYERLSTLQTTRVTVDQTQQSIAVLAGNLAATSGRDLAADLDALGVRFVLLDAAAADTPTALRVVDAISGDDRFSAIGSTPFGQLWQASQAPSAAPASATGPGPFDTAFGAVAAAVQLGVFSVVLLLAIPTTRRRRLRAARGRDAAPALDDEEGEDDDER